MKWFRFYTETLHNPKAQLLPAPMFKHWVNLLCLAAQEEEQGKLPPVAEISYHLGLAPAAVQKVLDALEAAGLIEATEQSLDMFVHNWMERQPRSDNAAERMANKRRTSSEHVPPRQDKRREEQNREEESRADRARALAPAGFVPVLEPFVKDEAGLLGEWRQQYEVAAGKLFSWAFEAEELIKAYGDDRVRSCASSYGWIKPPSYLKYKLDQQPPAVAASNGNGLKGRYD